MSLSPAGVLAIPVDYPGFRKLIRLRPATVQVDSIAYLPLADTTPEEVMADLLWHGIPVRASWIVRLTPLREPS